MTGKILSYSVSANRDLKPGRLLFVDKGSIPHTESKTIDQPLKNKSISILTLKLGDLWPESENKVKS